MSEADQKRVSVVKARSGKAAKKDGDTIGGEGGVKAFYVAKVKVG